MIHTYLCLGTFVDILKQRSSSKRVQERVLRHLTHMPMNKPIWTIFVCWFVSLIITHRTVISVSSRRKKLFYMYVSKMEFTYIELVGIHCPSAEGRHYVILAILESRNVKNNSSRHICLTLHVITFLPMRLYGISLYVWFLFSHGVFMWWVGLWLWEQNR